VRTFQRQRRVIVVSLTPFLVDVVESNVVAQDGVALTVCGTVVAQVIDPVLAVTRVMDYVDATRKLLQTAIRAGVKERPSRDVSDDLDDLATEVRETLSDVLGGWGVAVSSARLALVARADPGV
jgi:regulator of protease activity HflC (stomatin/prohibitin superfamily)